MILNAYINYFEKCWKKIICIYDILYNVDLSLHITDFSFHVANRCYLLVINVSGKLLFLFILEDLTSLRTSIQGFGFR